MATFYKIHFLLIALVGGFLFDKCLSAEKDLKSNGPVQRNRISERTCKGKTFEYICQILNGMAGDSDSVAGTGTHHRPLDPRMRDPKNVSARTHACECTVNCPAYGTCRICSTYCDEYEMKTDSGSLTCTCNISDKAVASSGASTARGPADKCFCTATCIPKNQYFNFPVCTLSVDLWQPQSKKCKCGHKNDKFTCEC